MLVGDWFRIGCDPTCVRNVLVFWPDEVLYDWLRNVMTSVTALTVIPLVMVAIWRHWRAAGAPARRTLLPLVVAVPLWLVLGALEILSRELDFQPGIDFFDSPSGTVIRWIAPLIFPVGLLLGMLRTRWSRGRIASLIVELGHGVPVGGLRDVLARTLGDPTLQLAFAAPSGSGFVDAAGLPIELPLSDPSRMVTRLERDDELLGVLVHDPAIEAEDPGLVGTLSGTVLFKRHGSVDRGLPTKGADPGWRWTSTGGKIPFWTLKVAELDTGRFATLLPTLDVHDGVSFGPAAPGARP